MQKAMKFLILFLYANHLPLAWANTVEPELTSRSIDDMITGVTYLNTSTANLRDVTLKFPTLSLSPSPTLLCTVSMDGTQYAAQLEITIELY